MFKNSVSPSTTFTVSHFNWKRVNCQGWPYCDVNYKKFSMQVVSRSKLLHQPALRRNPRECFQAGSNWDAGTEETSSVQLFTFSVHGTGIVDSLSYSRNRLSRRSSFIDLTDLKIVALRLLRLVDDSNRVFPLSKLFVESSLKSRNKLLQLLSPTPRNYRTQIAQPWFGLTPTLRVWNLF